MENVDLRSVYCAKPKAGFWQKQLFEKKMCSVKKDEKLLKFWHIAQKMGQNFGVLPYKM
ncbi:MAG: hypothetical protein IIX77_00370 [Oscillospiraceae bacterium]|nr:hypothetical protein [Oscillospiraceae bacterium]